MNSKSQGIINKHPFFSKSNWQCLFPFPQPTQLILKHEKSGTVHGFKQQQSQNLLVFVKPIKIERFSCKLFFSYNNPLFIFERLPMNCKWQNNHCTYSCDLCCYKIQFDNDKKNAVLIPNNVLFSVLWKDSIFPAEYNWYKTQITKYQYFMNGLLTFLLNQLLWSEYSP